MFDIYSVFLAICHDSKVLCKKKRKKDLHVQDCYRLVEGG